MNVPTPEVNIFEMVAMTCGIFFIAVCVVYMTKSVRGDETVNDDKRLENLKRQEYMGEFPTLMQAKKAFELFQQGQIGRLYRILWWANNPAGFTRFEFRRKEVFGHWLPTMSMNPQDAAMDVPGFIDPDAWIIVYGLELPESEGIYRLKSYPNSTFNSPMGNFSEVENG